MYIISALLNGDDVQEAIKQSRRYLQRREQLLNRVKTNEIPITDKQSSDRTNNLSSTMGDRSGC